MVSHRSNKQPKEKDGPAKAFLPRGEQGTRALVPQGPQDLLPPSLLPGTPTGLPGQGGFQDRPEGSKGALQVLFRALGGTDKAKGVQGQRAQGWGGGWEKQPGAARAAAAFLP